MGQENEIRGKNLRAQVRKIPLGMKKSRMERRKTEMKSENEQQ